MSILQRRRAMMMAASGTSPLPSGYTQLQYIASSGRSVIEFPVLSDMSVVEIEYSPDLANAQANLYDCIFGLNSNLQLAYNYLGKATKGNGTSENVFYHQDVKSVIRGRFTSTEANSFYYVDGVDTGLKRAFSISKKPFIFAAAISAYQAHGKMYSLRIWDSNNVLYHDLIPCINPNNVYGMYDIITDTFYSSDTNTPFTGG